jgi:DDE superfamily endonuclease
MWCIPEITPSFATKMEDVLSTYERPLNPKEPVVCLDEKPVCLHKDIRPPIQPERAGEVLKRDYEYERAGTANVFCGVEPKTGKRFAKATPNRKGPECAHRVKEIVEAYPDADKVHLVWDNLNTHREKPLVECFGEVEGRRIWGKVEVHYTPEHGSWLNQAEMAISIFTRQCLGKRRMGSFTELRRETSQWNKTANRTATPVRWTFTVAKARKKFKYKNPLSGMTED